MISLLSVYHLASHQTLLHVLKTAHRTDVLYYQLRGKGSLFPRYHQKELSGNRREQDG
jgi:hypothetical protein